MVRRVIASFVLALLVAGGARAAQAQNDAEDKRAEAREKIRKIVIAKLIEKLNVDEKTVAKLMPILEQANEQMAAVQKDSGAARRQLRRMLRRGKASDADINRLIDRLMENRAKLHKIESDMMAEARKVLKPVQAAQLMVVLPRIKARINAEIRKAAEGRKGGAPREGDEDADTEDDEEF